jgi:hypothetical protein
MITKGFSLEAQISLEKTFQNRETSMQGTTLYHEFQPT